MSDWPAKADATRADVERRQASTEQRGKWADHAANFAGWAGGQSAQAADRVRAGVEARRRRWEELAAQRLGRLDYFDADFWRESDQAARLHALLEAALMLGRAERGNIQFRDSGTGGLAVAAQQGFDSAFLRHFALVEDTGSACGLAYAEGAAVSVADVADSPVFAEPRTATVLLDAGVRAVHSVPIPAGGGGQLGVISVHYSRPNRIGDGQRRMLAVLSASAARRLLTDDVSQAWIG